MDVTVPAGQLQDAAAGSYRHEGLVVDVTFSGPQAVVHRLNGSDDFDRSAATTSEARQDNALRFQGRKIFATHS